MIRTRPLISCALGDGFVRLVTGQDPGARDGVLVRAESTQVHGGYGIDKDTLLKLFSGFAAPQLEAMAHAFEDGLRATAQEAPAFWRERIAPLFETYWPLSKGVQSPALCAILGAMLLETRDAFAEAVQLVIEDKPVLGAADNLFHAIYQLNREGPQGDDQTVRFPYAERFPLELLRLLDVLVDPKV